MTKCAKKQRDEELANDVTVVHKVPLSIVTAKICYKTGWATLTISPMTSWAALAPCPGLYQSPAVAWQQDCLPMWCYVMPLCSPRLQEFEYDFSKLSMGSGIQWHSLSVAWFPLGPNPVQIASPPQTSKPAPVVIRKIRFGKRETLSFDFANLRNAWLHP